MITLVPTRSALKPYPSPRWSPFQTSQEPFHDHRCFLEHCWHSVPLYMKCFRSEGLFFSRADSSSCDVIVDFIPPEENTIDVKVIVVRADK